MGAYLSTLFFRRVTQPLRQFRLLCNTPTQNLTNMDEEIPLQVGRAQQNSVFVIRNATFENDLLPTENIMNWIVGEMAKIEVSITSSNNSNRYHIWQYRIWLVRELMRNDEITNRQKQFILDIEYQQSSIYINKSTHFDDASAYDYRHKLLVIIVTTNSNGSPIFGQSLLVAELIHNAGMIEAHEGHETLWYHRRSLIMEAVDVLHSFQCTRKAVKLIAEDEQKFISRILSPLKQSHNKGAKEMNSKLCRQHAHWIKQRFNLILKTD